jgi:hypothetical protein
MTVHIPRFVETITLEGKKTALVSPSSDVASSFQSPVSKIGRRLPSGQGEERSRDISSVDALDVLAREEGKRKGGIPTKGSE